MDALIVVHPHVSPQEEGTDLPEFVPTRIHLLLEEEYGDFPHHNDGSHLDAGVLDGAF